MAKGLLVLYLIPAAWLGMWLDSGGSAAFWLGYLLLVLQVLPLLAMKRGQGPMLLLGGSLSGGISLVLALLTGMQGWRQNWDWYFKPFAPWQMVLVVTAAGFAVNWLLWKLLHKQVPDDIRLMPDPAAVMRPADAQICYRVLLRQGWKLHKTCDMLGVFRLNDAPHPQESCWILPQDSQTPPEAAVRPLGGRQKLVYAVEPPAHGGLAALCKGGGKRAVVWVVLTAMLCGLAVWVHFAWWIPAVCVGAVLAMHLWDWYRDTHMLLSRKTVRELWLRWLLYAAAIITTFGAAISLSGSFWVYLVLYLMLRIGFSVFKH